MILGLDISTTTTGFAVLSLDGTVVELGHISLGKLETVWDKADAIQTWAHQMVSHHTLTHIFVEQSLTAFRPGLSSAAVLASLTRFNGIASFIVRQETGLTPTFIGCTVARTACGIKVKKGKANGTGKEQAFRHVTSLMLHREWPLTKTGKVRQECFDEVDAYIIATAGLRSLNTR